MVMAMSPILEVPWQIRHIQTLPCPNLRFKTNLRAILTFLHSKRIRHWSTMVVHWDVSTRMHICGVKKGLDSCRAPEVAILFCQCGYAHKIRPQEDLCLHAHDTNRNSGICAVYLYTKYMQGPATGFNFHKQCRLLLRAHISEGHTEPIYAQRPQRASSNPSPLPTPPSDSSEGHLAKLSKYSGAAPPARAPPPVAVYLGSS